MFSFLNGKSPFDEAEEKLEAGETVNGKPKLPQAPVMGWQDAVSLLVFAALIFGGYQYYQYSKKSSADSFSRCNVLYESASTDVSKLIEAEACYDSTWDLGFVSDSMELLRQERLGFIDEKRTLQRDLFEDAQESLEKGDSVKAIELVKSYNGAMFLRKKEQAKWMQILEMQVSSQNTAIKDSL